jgi:DNA-binding response OmpR family regulator
MHASFSHLLTTGAQLLIVSDHPEFSQQLHHFLHEAGCRVATAAQASEALALCQEQTIDLVLLDVMGSEAAALALCQQLRCRSEVPMILMAAPDQTDAIVQGLDWGADDAIVHPFTYAELTARIGAVLRRLQWLRVQIRSFEPCSVETGPTAQPAEQRELAEIPALWPQPVLAFAADD